MRISTVMVFGACLAALPAAAHAQWAPGAELAGQSVQITTDGVVNTVYFDQGGIARIVTPGGNTIQGTWTSSASGLCLNVGANQECWSYATPVAAGQPVTMTSSCGAVSTWNAAATNVPPPPPPPQQPSAEGERG